VISDQSAAPAAHRWPTHCIRFERPDVDSRDIAIQMAVDAEYLGLSAQEEDQAAQDQSFHREFREKRIHGCAT
jgi:hypothetical protein